VSFLFLVKFPNDFINQPSFFLTIKQEKNMRMGAAKQRSSEGLRDQQKRNNGVDVARRREKEVV